MSTLTREVVVPADGFSGPLDVSALRAGGYALSALELPPGEYARLVFRGSREQEGALRDVFGAFGGRLVVVAPPDAYVTLAGPAAEALASLSVLAVAHDDPDVTLDLDDDVPELARETMPVTLVFARAGA